MRIEKSLYQLFTWIINTAIKLFSIENFNMLKPWNLSYFSQNALYFSYSISLYLEVLLSRPDPGL